MYVPPEFRMSNPDEAVQFIRKYPFGILISAQHNTPLVTHLPFVLVHEADQWVLETHLALDNPQAISLCDGDLLMAVFSGPHAYISPSLYTQVNQVPTWNYVAVHLQGKAQLCRTADTLLPLLERSIQAHEPEYLTQWTSVSKAYIDRLLKGILGIRMQVSQWEGTVKVSQNKPMPDQAQIMTQLSIHPQQAARDLVPYMTRSIKINP